MLNSFSISNFKAFGSEQRIPLRPITLVFGANSSGKSSILHSLLLARHALDTGDWDVTHPKLAGDSVELGGFSNYLHRKNKNPVGAVSLSFDRTLGTDFQPRSQLLPFAKELRLTLNVAVKTVLSSEKPALRDCQIDVDGSRLFLLTPKSDGELGINLWETSHPLSERLISWCQQTVGPEAVTNQSKATVVDAIHELNQTAVLSDSGFLPDDARFQTANVTLPSERKDNDQRIRAEVHRVYPQMIRDLLADLHDLFSHELRRLEYLGPLRSYPSRQLFDNETTDPNWRAGGGFAWKTV
ncbi:MAG: AAA family ATPase, partial [Verrucomicrobiaceae bacterium]